MEIPRYNPGLHRLALLTAAATFPLIFIGGLVTSHGAGLAVPDWPNSYGYNMFLFPPGKWVGNIWYEHVHRLYASFIGLLSIVLCAWAWKTDGRKSVRWLSAAVLGAVIFQGVLGGLRVVLVKLDLAVVHGCFGQAFFCLASLVALVTSPWWQDAPDLTGAKDSAAGRRVARLAGVAVAVVYGQLVVGAVMRHYQAGLAIPDFPLAYGHVLPPMNDAELMGVDRPYFLTDGIDAGPEFGPPKSAYARWMKLWPAGTGTPTLLWRTNADGDLRNVWLHFAHRVGAVVVSAVLLTLAYKVVRLHRGRPSLLGLALVLTVLLMTQVTLGALTVLLRKPADVASAHVATGALVLVTTFLMAARSLRLYSPRLRRPGEATRRSGRFEVVAGTRGVIVPALNAWQG